MSSRGKQRDNRLEDDTLDQQNVLQQEHQSQHHLHDRDEDQDHEAHHCSCQVACHIPCGERQMVAVDLKSVHQGWCWEAT